MSDKIDISKLDHMISQMIPPEKSKIILKWPLAEKLCAFCLMGASIDDDRVQQLATACGLVGKLIGGDIHYVDRRLTKIFSNDVKEH